MNPSEISKLVKDIEKSLKGMEKSTANIAKNIKTTADVSRGSSGTGTSGNSVMPNMPTTRAGMAGTLAMGALSAVGGLYGAVTGGMPDTTRTIQSATQYYNASIGQRSSVNYHNMRQATFGALKGGLTAVGNDARVAEYLSAQGINYSSKQGSQWMGTVTGVANAARYLNMDNMTAAAAITGLKSGSMSATLMRNFGIQTSDWSTGKTLSQGQIFGQLAQRLTAGQRQATEAETLASYQRGALGASLRASGLDETQQQMMAQFMLERARGNNLDLENSDVMNKLMKDAQANKDLNPAQAGMDINTSDTKLMNAASDTYIKAQQDAAKVIETVNDGLESLIPTVGYVKAAMDTLAGSQGTGGAIQGLGSALEGLTALILSIMSSLGGMAALKGGAGVAAGAAGAPKSGGGPRVAGKPKPGAKPSAAGGAGGRTAGAGAKAGVVGAVIGTAMTGIDAYNISKEGGDVWSGDFWGQVGVNAALGAGIGAVSGAGVLSLPGALIGGAIGAGSTILGNIIGSGIGAAEVSSNSARGGSGPTNLGSTTSSDTKTTVKFIKPVPGKVSSKFGMRSNPTGSGQQMHNGVDYESPSGTPVVASAAGDVLSTQSEPWRGNTVRIRHANGFTTIYQHLSGFNTTPGAKVSQGQQIGRVGATGDVTGPHLHFEILNASGAPINPETVLSGGSGAVTSTGTQQSAQTQKSGSILSNTTSAVSTESISDMRAKIKAGPLSGLRMGSSAAASPALSSGNKSTNSLVSSVTQPLGSSPKSGTVSSSRTKGMYLAGAPRAKDGDPYVANDGPVNVHAGEAILTAEQAAEWRDQMRGQGKSKGGNNVTINVTVASASEAEARRFAKVVKSYLEEDQLIGRMGRN